MRHLSAPTWGIDGPDSLTTYVVALIVCVAVAVVVRRFARRARVTGSTARSR